MDDELFSEQEMDIAARDGHLDIVKFLHENRDEGCSSYAMDTAAMNDELEVLKFLHENRDEGCTPDALSYSAASGYLDVVKFLVEVRGEPCTREVLDRAHADVSDYLRARFPDIEMDLIATGCSKAAASFAMLNGHLDVLEYLVKLRISEWCPNELIKLTATRGNLHAVQVLYKYEHKDKNCPHPLSAIKEAVKYRHLPIVQWLCESGILKT
ncbi:hypothetical protein HDV05_002096 [Chytridiales sp. JEL 0842]|nr:hypothetical protein HDV05_002096 [Chytridiales sp. JEL 0842]